MAKKKKLSFDVTETEYKRVVNLRKLGIPPSRIKKIVFGKQKK